MRQMLSIAGKDLRLRLRDRSVFIVGILAPGLLAVIFSLVFGDALNPSGGDFTADYGYVDLDNTEASQSLGMVLGVIAESDQFTIVELDTVTDAEAAIEDGALESVFVAPNGFGAAVTAGISTEIEVIGDVDAPISSGIAVAIAEGYAENVERVALTVAGAIAAGADPSAVPTIIEEARTALPVATIGDIETEVRQMTGATFAMAGMAVFFLFFTVQFGVAGLLEERRLGTWARLLAAPLRRRTIIGAKALVSFVLGIVSMTVLMLGATIGLGAEWGDPVAVAALVVMGVLAATGVMAIVAATAKTVEGAGNVQAIVAVTLGMLGGTFVPIASDGIISALSKLTPHAWFLAGLNDLAGGGGIERVVPSILAIGAFALVAWLIAFGAFARKGMQ